MALRKRRLDRRVVDLKVDGTEVAHMPAPWTFTIDCRHHGPIAFDFLEFRGCGREDLAAHLRDAVWGMRHTHLGLTLKKYRDTLPVFFRFLGDVADAVRCVDEVTREVLDAYIAWLAQQLRLEGEKRGQPWSLGAQISHYNALKSLLKHLRRWAPERTRLLAFPRNPYPNASRLMDSRQSYSVAESERLIDALNVDLRALHQDSGSLTPLQVLAVHLLVLGLTTGRNMQSLLELTRDCLQPHAAPGRKILVTSKRRGYSTHQSSLPADGIAAEDLRDVVIPNNVAGHIEWLAAHTASLMSRVEARYASRIFLRVPLQGKNKDRGVPLDPNAVNAALTTFVRRHQLKDDAGKPLALCMARLRPTFGNAIYARSGGDLRVVQKALNHSDLRTTVNHYLGVPPQAERDHALVIEAMVGWARKEVDGKMMIAADGRIPLVDVNELLSGGYNTGVARCRNPFRDNDSVCSKFFTCFRCQNMVVFEDDLWRLFSFYFRLLQERIKVAPHHWAQTYGPIIRRIDTDIAPQFPSATVEQARIRAQRDPHPMWKGPVL